MKGVYIIHLYAALSLFGATYYLLLLGKAREGLRMKAVEGGLLLGRVSPKFKSLRRN
jgi:hypothetical protein